MKSFAKTMKAVSDEIRLRIVALLSEHGELCVCDLIAGLDIPQSTVSRHLAYLKGAGWVDDRRAGLWVYYRLNRKDPLIKDLARVVIKHIGGSKSVAKDRDRLTRCGSKKQLCCDV